MTRTAAFKSLFNRQLQRLSLRGTYRLGSPFQLDSRGEVSTFVPSNFLQ